MGDLRNRYVWLVLVVMLAFGAIGWYDDWIKLARRDPNGLKSRWKYFVAVDLWFSCWLVSLLYC